MKKKMIAMILTGLCVCSAIPANAHATENLYGKYPEKTIIFNEDSDTFLRTRMPTKAAIDEWADQYAKTNVGVMMLNTQAFRINYASSVMDVFYEDIGAGMPEMLEACPQTLYQAHKKGLEWNKLRITSLRERGISPWITIRTNDIHDRDVVAESIFKKEHSDMVIGTSQSKNEFKYCLDYRIPAVRNYYYAVIRENIERYDIDGIELDWMRESYEIKDDSVREETRIAINQFTRDIRKVLDIAEMERGHEIHLAVRVPAQISAAENFALDVKTWCSEKLVDLVTVSPRWHSTDTDMELENWIKLIREDAGNPNVKVGAAMEVIYRSNPDYGAKHNSNETGRGAAFSFLSRGADHVYLFNHFDTYGNWFPMLSQINDVENMKGTVRRQAVTFHDRWAYHDTPVYALPATSSSANTPSFRVHMGNISTIRDTENYYALIGVNQSIATIDAASDCTVKVNGVVCEYKGNVADLPAPYPIVSGVNCDVAKYAIPASAMQDGYNVVSVESADGTSRTLTWVEIYVEPKNN